MFCVPQAEDPPVTPATDGDQSTAIPEQMLTESNQKLLELRRLQEEQLKLTEQEIQEHQMKRDLLLKKQQTERQLLLQQLQVEGTSTETTKLTDSKVCIVFTVSRFIYSKCYVNRGRINANSGV